MNDAGAPVAYARVFISQALIAGYAQATPPPVITGPQVSSAMAGATGQFAAVLPPGSYVACAETTAQGFLDPCHFSSAAPSFNVTKGQILSGVKVIMTKGAILSVHLADPYALLAVPSGPPNVVFRPWGQTGQNATPCETPLPIGGPNGPFKY